MVRALGNRIPEEARPTALEQPTSLPLRRSESLLAARSAWLGGGVSRATVLMTMNQLAVMCRNGIDIAEALDTVSTHCKHKVFAASLRRIYDAVSAGQPFSIAVGAYGIHFPPTLAPMLAAAEATGDVPETLRDACARLRGEIQMRGTVLGALIYPAILTFASATVLAALVLGVLPQFSKVFASLGRPTPVTTEWLLAAGDFFRAWWMWLLPLIVGIPVGLFLSRRHPWVQRPINYMLMFSWPIRDAYRPLQAGRMFRSMAAMVAGGVPLLQTVRLARQTTGDLYWHRLLDRIEESLIDGSSASTAMAGVEFIPPETAQMMATAERTGRVAEVLESVGEFYEQEASRRHQAVHGRSRAGDHPGDGNRGRLRGDVPAAPAVGRDDHGLVAILRIAPQCRVGCNGRSQWVAWFRLTGCCRDLHPEGSLRPNR